MNTTYQQYYKQKLETGQEYQDYISQRLLLEGLPVVNYQSRRWQIDHGENAFGLEIKYDDLFSRTGNVWIEVAEKSSPSNPTYVDSGICRDDNSWLYGIGSYEEFLIFSKRHLRAVYSANRYAVRENSTKTSRGFLIPRCDLSEHTERMFYWPEQAKP